VWLGVGGWHVGRVPAGPPSYLSSCADPVGGCLSVLQAACPTRSVARATCWRTLQQSRRPPSSQAQHSVEAAAKVKKGRLALAVS
jgi:hypothetical protein